MLYRSLLIVAAALAGAAGVGAQEEPRTRDSKKEALPDVNERLRRLRIDRSPMVVTVTPNDRVVVEAPPPSRASGPCAIPLIGLGSISGGAVRQFEPDDRGSIRVIEPRVCDEWFERKGPKPAVRPAEPR